MPVDTYVNGSQVWLRDEPLSGVYIKSLYGVNNETLSNVNHRSLTGDDNETLSNVNSEANNLADIDNNENLAHTSDTIAIEYRLHPVKSFVMPKGTDPADLFSEVALQGHPSALINQVDNLWDGLEAFPAYDDEIEPAHLAQIVFRALKIKPDAFGLVDHEQIGSLWEKSSRSISIFGELAKQLNVASAR